MQSHPVLFSPSAIFPFLVVFLQAPAVHAEILAGSTAVHWKVKPFSLKCRLFDLLPFKLLIASNCFWDLSIAMDMWIANSELPACAATDGPQFHLPVAADASDGLQAGRPTTFSLITNIISLSRSQGLGGHFDWPIHSGQPLRGKHTVPSFPC